LCAGALIDRMGFRATEALYCAIGIGFTIAIGVWWRADLWRIQGAANMR
jgi:hypothetical protein